MPALDSFFLTCFTSEPSAGENNIFMRKPRATSAKTQLGENTEIHPGIYGQALSLREPSRRAKVGDVPFLDLIKLLVRLHRFEFREFAFHVVRRAEAEADVGSV